MFSWFLDVQRLRADCMGGWRGTLRGLWLVFSSEPATTRCVGSPTVQAGSRMSVFCGGFQSSLGPEGDLMAGRNSGLFGSTHHSSRVLLRAGICQFTQGRVPWMCAQQPGQLLTRRWGNCWPRLPSAAPVLSVARRGGRGGVLAVAISVCQAFGRDKHQCAGTAWHSFTLWSMKTCVCMYVCVCFHIYGVFS